MYSVYVVNFFELAVAVGAMCCNIINDHHARVGGQCVVDPSPEEEECSSASLLVAITPDGQ